MIASNDEASACSWVRPRPSVSVGTNRIPPPTPNRPASTPATSPTTTTRTIVHISAPSSPAAGPAGRLRDTAQERTARPKSRRRGAPPPAGSLDVVTAGALDQQLHADADEEEGEEQRERPVRDLLLQGGAGDRAGRGRQAHDRGRARLQLAVERVRDRPGQGDDPDRRERGRHRRALLPPLEQEEERDDDDSAPDAEERAEQACREADHHELRHGASRHGRLFSRRWWTRGTSSPVSRSIRARRRSCSTSTARSRRSSTGPRTPPSPRLRVPWSPSSPIAMPSSPASAGGPPTRSGDWLRSTASSSSVSTASSSTRAPSAGPATCRRSPTPATGRQSASD